MRGFAKIVPDADPDADGVWVKFDESNHDGDLFTLRLRPDWHVVTAVLIAVDVEPHQLRADLQDGGPMHAAMLGGMSPHE